MSDSSLEKTVTETKIKKDAKVFLTHLNGHSPFEIVDTVNKLRALPQEEREKSVYTFISDVYQRNGYMIVKEIKK